MDIDEAEANAFEYEDALLGFRFSKPHGWFVIPRPEALESLRSRILGCVSDDLQDHLNALLGRPAVMIAKHRHLEWGVNPNFQISPGPAGDDDPVDLMSDGLATWGERESGARPVVVLTKVDLAHDVGELERTLASIAIGVPVRAVSTVDRETLSGLSPDLKMGSTVALLGPSGAGKSTLVNALLDRDLLRTASVRSSDHKGRHTTTWRQLVRLESGALLIDTPGMRELQLQDAGDGIDRTFADITELAARCRYSDCLHDSEPGCAVREALEQGQLDTGRLRSYRKLSAEAAHQQRKADARLRHDEVGRIKTIQKSLREHLKRKHQ